MNQRQVILALVAVGLVSGALWVWLQSSDDSDTTPVQAAAPIQATEAPPPPGQVAASDSVAPAPVTPPPQTEPAPAAPDVSQSAVSAPVEPRNVDTPEPAERKFSRGAKPESDEL